MENREFTLQESTVGTLKFWNSRYPCVEYDRLFIKKLAEDVFGIDSLAKSSVNGTRARNANVRHEALDKIKLEFVRGNVVFVV